MIRSTCEITDQLARKTAFRLSFNFYTLILTLKPAPGMHQNAPLPDKKNETIFWGGAPPLQFPSPVFLRLDSRAFGARRSHSFSFTTRTLTLIACKPTDSTALPLYTTCRGSQWQLSGSGPRGSSLLPSVNVCRAIIFQCSLWNQTSFYGVSSQSRSNTIVFPDQLKKLHRRI